MDTYNLINSKAISNYCRSIKHKFNTEELAVLIYRNNSLNITEKIKKYNELIENYPDMEVIERINCEHYDSVKTLIKNEIERLKILNKKIRNTEDNTVITVPNLLYNDVYKSYEEACQEILKELNSEEIKSFKLIKKYLTGKKNELRVECIWNKKEIKIVNIIDSENHFLDIDNICLNIPTPFKKGDLLVSKYKSVFNDENELNGGVYPFVLGYLCNWDKDFQEILDKGNHDSSDMQGPGYMVGKDGLLYWDNVFDYDSWEYYDEKIYGKLKGMDRLLITTSNLMKGEIDISLFLGAYENLKRESTKSNLDLFTKEGLKLAGIEDYKKLTSDLRG